MTAEGSVYTIAPRLLLPRAWADAPEGVTRTFWLTVKTPADAPAGVYRGEVRLAAEQGGTLTLPLRFTVRKGTLDPVDMPAGPFGHTIDLPWFEDEAAAWNHNMAVKSLKKLREYGFTTATGLPGAHLPRLQGRQAADRLLRGDAQMKLFKEAGFPMPVVSYCPFDGLNIYYKDEAAMRAAGFTDYSEFIKAIFSAVQKHADEAGWLPVYWNIGDEPIGDDVVRAAENAEAYRKAFPKGPPYFTAASSFAGSDAKDPHFRLAKALHVVNWNLHDRAGVKLSARRGRRLGLLQRRQPLDLRRLHVQGGEAVRHEVPAGVALERRGRRPVLRAGLPRGRLRLVQLQPGRGADPVGAIRAAARGAGRLPAAADAGPAGAGAGRQRGRRGGREIDRRDPRRLRAGRPGAEERRRLCRGPPTP